MARQKRSLGKSVIFSTIDTRIEQCNDQLDQVMAACENKEEVNLKVYRASIERYLYKSIRLEFENLFDEE